VATTELTYLMSLYSFYFLRSGHGDEICDLKFSQSDKWLLVTASKDESLRLWNLQTATCIAILSGHYGHRDSVISVAFHPLGHSIISGGMDTTIKMWSLNNDEMKDAIEDSFNLKPRALGGLKQDETDRRYALRTRFEQDPYFSTKKLHTDYVDCVQFVGDLVLSKSSAMNTIVLWKPDLLQKERGVRHFDKVIVLREFHLTKCEVWFIRFQTDSSHRLLSIGNQSGEIKIWKINNSAKGGHFLKLSQTLCNSTVRMVSFSPDGNSLVAVCDDASVFKWDASK